eukprot:CAMPEP_0117450202 /NCGR_PEP_ID=MMETSP0759-20121206/8344_1 /TAXON_ID=63605 /ORGANISM="Percolomonas cosmopolitus, Strain WS" /LENGTH=88 /DNA_ID=CAMNT_0005242711 /DNA_START=38 /DNA_END=301 /DNA_ORIENTATION=-
MDTERPTLKQGDAPSTNATGTSNAMAGKAPEEGMMKKLGRGMKNMSDKASFREHLEKRPDNPDVRKNYNKEAHMKRECEGSTLHVFQH